MGITINVDMGSVRERLRGLAQNDVPFLTAFALTKTAQDIKAAEVDQMERVFDRPTRWTLNSLKVTPATKQDLTAIVDFREFGGTPGWKYLGPQIMGGGRRKKAHERALERAGILRAGEYAVPGQGVALDAYGNMPGSLITRILSAVRANPDPFQNRRIKGQIANTKRRRKGGPDYFVSRGRAGAPDGIYHRAGRRTVPVIVFVRPPAYARRFPFYETASRLAHVRFEHHFWEGFRRYVGSARPSA